MMQVATPLFLSVMVIACSSDPAETMQDDSESNLEIVQDRLLDYDWTLETVRSSDGEYRPLPLNATWHLSFQTDGRVFGEALCNAGSGDWQAVDTTLNIVNWNEDAAFCPDSQTIPNITQEIVARLLGSETLMPRIDAGRLFLDTGDNAQLVFSGRLKNTSEQIVPVETIVSSLGFARASNGNPVFGDLSTPYVVYRDAASLNADYAAVPPEGAPQSELPVIDFTNSIVIGAYLPLDVQVSSDVVVRGASVIDSMLDIEIARFGPSVPEEATVGCAAGDALTAPWTLVRVDSVVEPVRFNEMARAFCSGIPSRE